jgi:hypothetical protein
VQADLPFAVVGGDGPADLREPREEGTQAACRLLGKRLAEWVAVFCDGRTDQHLSASWTCGCRRVDHAVRAGSASRPTAEGRSTVAAVAAATVG